MTLDLNIDAEGHCPDDGIDYEEIVATTQPDWLAGNYREFKGSDYPDEESLIMALEAYHAECRIAARR